MREKIAKAEELYEKGNIRMSAEQFLDLVPHSDYRDELKNRLISIVGEPEASTVLVERIDTQPRFVVDVLESTGAVELLVSVLKHDDQNVRKKAAEALERITCKDFGQDSEKWQKWWKANKDSFGKGR